MKSDAEACQIVADHSNRGILDQISVRSQSSTPKMKEFERIFGKDTLDTPAAGLSYWRLDFDNDGILDHLVISVHGTLGVSSGHVLSGKKGSAAKELVDEYIHLSVLKVGERCYVLSHYEDQMGRLWRLSKGGGFVPVCQYKQRKEPMIELIVGKERAVCSEDHLGRVHHVSYSLMHGLGSLPTEDEYPIEGLAQVDIDNDGKPDNVVRIDFMRRWGRGCDGRYIAVTDDTRTNIPGTKLNELLSDKRLCDSHMDVFVHEGTTYVDSQGHAGDRVIYLIRGEKIETICEFRGRLIHDVEGDVREQGK